MKNIFKSFMTACMLLSVAMTGVAQKDYSKSEGLLQYVDPYIGSGFHGHVFVGTSVPYGMVQGGPNNIYKGWDWCSGYHYSDSILIGFSQTHLNGTGCSDLGDIMVMPMNEIRTERGQQNDISNGYASMYSHKTEIARPEYYSVMVEKYNIKAELTATNRVALHRYTYPAGKPASILVDIAEVFGVTVDYLVSADHTHTPIAESSVAKRKYNRKPIAYIAESAAWLVAIFAFIITTLILQKMSFQFLYFLRIFDH